MAVASGFPLISLHNIRGEAQPPENRPIKSQIAGYVTSNTCRSCHSGNYASWHASFHRTMTQVATPASLPTNMDRIELAFDGTKYKVQRRSDACFVRKRSEGGSSHGDAQRIVLGTGSHTLRVPWLESGQRRT